MIKKITKKTKTCLDCPDHEVINDRDPDDWFCDDDIAVVCKKLQIPIETKLLNGFQIGMNTK